MPRLLWLCGSPTCPAQGGIPIAHRSDEVSPVLRGLWIQMGLFDRIWSLGAQGEATFRHYLCFVRGSFHISGLSRDALCTTFTT